MSPASFRFRYLLGLLCHIALTFVGCHQARVTQAAAPPVLSSCGLKPSFESATELKRWERFPVDVYIDLASFPEATRERYRDGVERGVKLWAQGTRGRIGTFRIHYDRPDAPVTISLAEEPLPDKAIGSTALTFRANRIVTATVQLTRSLFEDTPFLVQDVASTTAHEIGHALGIVDHSPFPEDKMWVSGNFNADTADQEPESLLTARDVNTLNEAYCR